jgi:alpha-D-xyloside xylohydrolase
MKVFTRQGNTLLWRMLRQTLRIEPWGKNGLRVRITAGTGIPEKPGVLLEQAKVKVTIKIKNDVALIRNGKIKAEVESKGAVRFHRSSDGTVLVEEKRGIWGPPARLMRPAGGDLYRAEVSFNAFEDERLYGLGQHKNGLLNQKGCVIDLMQENTEVAIPFMLSTRGYGFIWNNPAIGRVELGRDRTRWTANATTHIDYVIMAGDSFAEIMQRYVDATGYPPMLPEWAAGFWQCKLRYRTQDELLSIAREYKRRKLPLSVIVIDFHHWKNMGDWSFEKKYWPDPVGMVRQLEEMNIKVMVSIWPTVCETSENFQEMLDKGLLIDTDRGSPVHLFSPWSTKPGQKNLYHYDPTNPDARKYIWQKVRKSYYRYGIKVWWLDACEPEINPADYDNLRYHIGNGAVVGCIHPLMHQQGFYDGMRSEGEKEIITLCRSAWLGSQRYGAAVWSGDILSTFESLRQQVRAGLNIAMSGIYWWTTDIGGFHSGDINSPYFRELIVRWFQYGVFCPLFRLHGMRQPAEADCGAPNEVWSFGRKAYGIIRQVLLLREKLRPYIMKQMRVAHKTGLPMMRPLFFDFAEDENCYDVEDQFLFGPDILVAPVLHRGAKSREVYLPEGASWKEAGGKKKLKGGRWIKADAPLEKIPFYIRAGSDLSIDGIT